LEKSVFFPLKIPKHFEKFQKIGVGIAKCHAHCYNAGHTTGRTVPNDGRTTHNVGRNTLNVPPGAP